MNPSALNHEKLTILILLAAFLKRNGRVYTLPPEHANVSYKDYSLVENKEGVFLSRVPKKDPPAPFYSEPHVIDVFIGAAVVLTKIIVVSNAGPKMPPYRMVAGIQEMRKTASRITELGLFLRVDAISRHVTFAVVEKALGIRDLIEASSKADPLPKDLFRYLEITPNLP